MVAHRPIHILGGAKLHHFVRLNFIFAVLARGIPSVCPFVCLSVTFRYCVQTNDDTVVCAPSGSVKVNHPSIDSENSTNNIGTCEASRFDSISNRTSDSGFDS